jgi:Zn-dependent peptidase ImmA (M78 family)/transcriptional regulator with XRE-family HTH domain
MNAIERADPVKLGDRLRIARSTVGLKQDEAARELGVARTTLIAIEKGQRRVRPEELRRLADIYNIGINELFRETAIHVDLAAKFRRAANEGSSSPAPEEAVRLLSRLASAMVELEERLGQRVECHYLPEKPVLSGALEEQAEDMALDLRHRLGLGLAPISDIVSLVELEMGMRVFLRPIDSSISGLFAFDPAVGACMLINSKHSAERQALTIAHELGHFLTTRAAPDVNEETVLQTSRQEKFVNHFALSLLMPAAAVRRRFRDLCAGSDQFSPRQLILMAHAFKVAVEAMCRRLEGLKLLPQGTFDSLKERGFAIERARASVGLSEAVNQAKSPPRLMLLAVTAYRRDLLSEGQLCEMLALNRAELREYLDMFGDNHLDDAIPIQT